LAQPLGLLRIKDCVLVQPFPKRLVARYLAQPFLKVVFKSAL